MYFREDMRSWKSGTVDSLTMFANRIERSKESHELLLWWGEVNESLEGFRLRQTNVC